jgi:thiamine pyrophosphate-dependent acetolactate synthase large subunit-like protein
MGMRPVTANSSQLLVEQLSASGVEYVFYNSGSREALFFDALHSHPKIHGILALHEGSVTAMAGGYTQVKLDAGVMVVHLGAGLAQSLGQLINVWSGSLPVVVITFAGDTGSFADKIELDLHHSFGPTSISAPFTKASWTVIEPEGLPQAVARALRVAKTPPVGPVHLAVYDRLLGREQINTNIVDGAIADVRAGYPADSDVEEIARALRDADRPLIYVGDGVWKTGAEAGVMALAEYFGVPVAGDTRSVSIRHRLHCGPFGEAVASIEPDLVLCAGVRHRGQGVAEDFGGLSTPPRIIAVGAGVEYMKNIPGVGLTVLADEARTFERLRELTFDDGEGAMFDERRSWAQEQSRALRARRRAAAEGVAPQAGAVRPYLVADAVDRSLEEVGGGLVTTEQFAVPLDAVGESDEPGRNVYIRPAGGSEGYGVGGALGVKLAAPDRPVVGLVGDGSLYYADSGLWTAAHHRIPVLYIIANNGTYGIVADHFGRAEGDMKKSGGYEGVVLDAIDPVKLAEAYGVEGIHVQDEDQVAPAIKRGLYTVEREGRPLLLDVSLPLGLPAGGHAAAPYRLSRARG